MNSPTDKLSQGDNKLDQTLTVWGVNLPSELFQSDELEYLRNAEIMQKPPVEWLWLEMDRVWRDLELDNQKPLKNQAVGGFYSHPVWLLNGLFSATDPSSVLHRELIASFISNLNVERVADYGGGMGELALKLCNTSPYVMVDIVEPYPSKFGTYRIKAVKKAKFVDQFQKDLYECVIAQDVLEHVEDPVGLAIQMANATSENGKIIFANCFYPVIQCHLPATFHLRHTFIWVMRALGLHYLGPVPGVNHALVFQRVGNLNHANARRAESISQLLGPVINVISGVVNRLKH